MLVYFSGDWDVHWGYGMLTGDPRPYYFSPFGLPIKANPKKGSSPKEDGSCGFECQKASGIPQGVARAADGGGCAHWSRRLQGIELQLRRRCFVLRGSTSLLSFSLFPLASVGFRWLKRSFWNETGNTTVL